jgi:hypothetical protein
VVLVSSVAGWSAAEVTAWAKTLSPSLPNNLATLFAANGVSGRDLCDLSHDDLASMGVRTLSARKAVLRAVTQLLAAHGQTSSSSA